MPRVKFLNLSFNNLTTQLDAGQWRLACLRNLILNGTKIDWKSVRRLLKMLPRSVTAELSSIFRNLFKKMNPVVEDG
jgi:hypothetical protein